MPVHPLLEQILNEYIVAAGLQSGQPLFQSLNSLGTEITGSALNRYNAWAAIRKRARAAGFLTPVGCHTWRATGITISGERHGSSTPNKSTIGRDIYLAPSAEQGMEHLLAKSVDDIGMPDVDGYSLMRPHPCT